MPHDRFSPWLRFWQACSGYPGLLILALGAALTQIVVAENDKLFFQLSDLEFRAQSLRSASEDFVTKLGAANSAEQAAEVFDGLILTAKAFSHAWDTISPALRFRLALRSKIARPEFAQLERIESQLRDSLRAVAEKTKANGLDLDKLEDSHRASIYLHLLLDCQEEELNVLKAMHELLEARPPS